MTICLSKSVSWAQGRRDQKSNVLIREQWVFTDGGDHGDSEEEALAQAPVAAVQVPPPRADTPVEDLLQQPLEVVRGHAWVCREKLTLAELNVGLKQF